MNPPPTDFDPAARDARYRAFVLQTLDAVCIYQADTKRLVETNPAFCRLLGYTPAEAGTLTMDDLLPQASGSVTAYFYEIIASERSSRSERQWRRKDGTLIDVQVTASLITESQPALIFVLARDITDRKQAEASLRQARERYQALFDEAPVMYVITQERDGAARIVDCNHQFLQTLDYPREAVLGQPLARFFTETTLLAHGAGRGRAVTASLAREERRLVARDGRVVHTLMRTAPETDLQGRPVAQRVMFIDVSERRQAEADLRADIVLDDLTRLAASALDFPSTAQLLVDQLAELTHADSCHLSLWDGDRQRLVPIAAAGPQHAALADLPAEADLQKINQTVVQTGQLLVVADVFASPHTSPVLGTRLPVRSLLCLPLVAGDRGLGTALITYQTPHRFLPEEIGLAERAAGPLALAIAKARLFEDLQTAHQQLTEAYDATLEGWAIALELRDKETQGHTRRVTEMTLRLARQMGLPESDLVNIRRGALLHDIGKIGIPDEILRKPGPLTDAERIVMSRHTIYAYEIIAAIPFLYPAIDIPYCHHEKWDGTGYPRGLQDEAIPLAARLFAVVDVWDALRSDRPYRESWPAAKVLDHIRLLSGSHFDPAVVAAFVQLLAAEVDSPVALG